MAEREPLAIADRGCVIPQEDMGSSWYKKKL